MAIRSKKMHSRRTVSRPVSGETDKKGHAMCRTLKQTGSLGMALGHLLALRDCFSAHTERACLRAGWSLSGHYDHGRGARRAHAVGSHLP